MALTVIASGQHKSNLAETLQGRDNAMEIVSQKHQKCPFCGIQPCGPWSLGTADFDASSRIKSRVAGMVEAINQTCKNRTMIWATPSLVSVKYKEWLLPGPINARSKTKLVMSRTLGSLVPIRVFDVKPALRIQEKSYAMGLGVEIRLHSIPCREIRFQCSRTIPTTKNHAAPVISTPSSHFAR